MAGMEKIGEAILDKVKAEADEILKDAENRAAEAVVQAKEQQAAMREEAKAKMLQAARDEATRIQAQAAVKARQTLSQAKAEVVGAIIDRAKQELAGSAGDAAHLVALIKEAVGVLGVSQGRVYATPKDMAAIKKLVEKDKDLAGKVAEFKEHKSLGGIIVESSDGKVRIDNTYETRLEMLLPQLLPEVAKELFGS